MESLETNKAVAAVLVAGIAFVGAGQLANVLVHPKPLHEAAIKIEGVETAAAPPTQHASALGWSPDSGSASDGLRDRVRSAVLCP